MKIITRKTFITLDEAEYAALKKAAEICTHLEEAWENDSMDDLYNVFEYCPDFTTAKETLLNIIETISKKFPTEENSNDIIITW